MGRNDCRSGWARTRSWEVMPEPWRLQEDLIRAVPPRSTSIKRLARVLLYVGRHPTSGPRSRSSVAGMECLTRLELTAWATLHHFYPCTTVCRGHSAADPAQRGVEIEIAPASRCRWDNWKVSSKTARPLNNESPL